MYALERYRSIVERVTGKGRASVADLADDLSVTPETIRRDLSVLEQQGLVRRVHGGAVPVGKVAFEASISDRIDASISEKMVIAKTAVMEIPNHATVIVDSGTTTGRMLSLLPKDLELQIITNSPAHALSLVNHKNVSVMLAGGRLRNSTVSCVDSWAINAISTINVDLVFVGTNGISIAKGLTTPDPAESAIKSAMLKAGARKILLADSSKFNQTHFSTFADVRDLDLIISDNSLDEGLVAQFESVGPKLVLA